MIDRGFHWGDGICDWCYIEHFTKRVEEKAPNCTNREGWVKPVEESREKYGEAIRQVQMEMITRVAKITTVDCDGGQLCEDCLGKILVGKG